MKNIVLITRANTPNELKKNFDSIRKEIVNRILAEGEYKICMLLTHPATNKDYYVNLLGEDVVHSALDVEYEESTKGLDYENITRNKSIQVCIENYYMRMDHDYQLDKYYYYTGLSYWLSFYKKNKIDIVINASCLRDGSSWDIPSEVAECLGIKTFYIEMEGQNDTYCITHNRHLYKNFCGEMESVKEMLKLDFDRTKPDPIDKRKKNLVRTFLYKIGGNLLEDFFMRAVRWDWSPMRVSYKRYKASWSEKFFGYIKLKLIERYLDNNSIQYEDSGEKFVFFALHLEPEATILARHVLESQLVIIKMLSETLPSGWMLYVKEHPLQFCANLDGAYIYMLQSYRFKTKKFYEKISSFPNVRIIHKKVSSNILIKNSQAVASVSGTVLWESVVQKKPIFVFSRLCPLSQGDDAFNIQSFADCKQAMDKVNCGFSPKYEDMDKVTQEYIFREKYMADNIIGILHTECPND